ncbi:MAG TPA: hypothetical protein VFM18_07615 [Methanosarcina sp.]|nr:hypothetical protein [Methanosarcina sp.]
MSNTETHPETMAQLHEYIRKQHIMLSRADGLVVDRFSETESATMIHFTNGWFSCLVQDDGYVVNRLPLGVILDPALLVRHGLISDEVRENLLKKEKDLQEGRKLQRDLKEFQRLAGVLGKKVKILDDV